MNHDEGAAAAVRHAFHSFEQLCTATHHEQQQTGDAPYRIIALLLSLARAPSSPAELSSQWAAPLDVSSSNSQPLPHPHSARQLQAADEDSEEDDDDGWQAEYSRSTSESEEEDSGDGPSPATAVASMQKESTAERWARLRETEQRPTDASPSQSDYLQALDVVWQKVEDGDAGTVGKLGSVGDGAPLDRGKKATSSPPSLQRLLHEHADAERLTRSVYTPPVPVVSEAFVVFQLLLLCQHMPNALREWDSATSTYRSIQALAVPHLSIVSLASIVATSARHAANTRNILAFVERSPPHHTPPLRSRLRSIAVSASRSPSPHCSTVCSAIALRLSAPLAAATRG